MTHAQSLRESLLELRQVRADGCYPVRSENVGDAPLLVPRHMGR
jgi:hypothetical protein